jgi:hypothetical protein
MLHCTVFKKQRMAGIKKGQHLAVSAQSVSANLNYRILETLPELGEVRRAVQAKLHAVVDEAVVGLIRVLLGRLDVQDVVAAKGELGVFVKAVGKRQVGRSLGLVVGVWARRFSVPEKVPRVWLPKWMIFRLVSHWPWL